jgi:uncharacterized protein (DUF3084 family)
LKACQDAYANEKQSLELELETMTNTKDQIEQERDELNEMYGKASQSLSTQSARLSAKACRSMLQLMYLI